MSQGSSLLRTLGDGLSSLFGRPSLDKFRDQTPIFIPEQHLNGQFKATGMIQDRQGTILSRFDINMNFSWEGDQGKLIEQYQFHGQSEVQTKAWTITKLADQRYQGKADDLVGLATGQCAGNAFNWRYRMSIPVNGRPMTFSVDDWMWLHHDDTIINRSRFKKLGLTVAELTVFMHKVAS